MDTGSLLKPLALNSISIFLFYRHKLLLIHPVPSLTGSRAKLRRGFWLYDKVERLYRRLKALAGVPFLYSLIFRESLLLNQPLPTGNRDTGVTQTIIVR